MPPSLLRARPTLPLNCLTSVFVGRRRPLAVATLLLEWEDKVTMDRRGRGGRTALHFAVMARQDDVVRTLVDYGADVSVADDTGETPLAALRRIGNTELAKRLERERAALLAATTLAPLAPGTPELQWALNTAVVVKWSPPEPGAVEEVEVSAESSAFPTPGVATAVRRPAKKYHLQVARAIVGSWVTVSDNIRKTQMLVPDLTEGARYTMRVCAYNEAGWSPWSSSSAYMIPGVVDDNAPREDDAAASAGLGSGGAGGLLSTIFGGGGGGSSDGAADSGSAAAAGGAGDASPPAPPPRRDSFRHIRSVSERVAPATSDSLPAVGELHRGSSDELLDKLRSVEDSVTPVRDTPAVAAKPRASAPPPQPPARRERHLRGAGAAAAPRSSSDGTVRLLTGSLQRETRRRELAEAEVARLSAERGVIDGLGDAELAELEAKLMRSLDIVRAAKAGRALDDVGMNPSRDSSAASTGGDVGKKVT